MYFYHSLTVIKIWGTSVITLSGCITFLRLFKQIPELENDINNGPWGPQLSGQWNDPRGKWSFQNYVLCRLNPSLSLVRVKAEKPK